MLFFLAAKYFEDHTEIPFIFCRYRGWLARRFCYVLFVQERDVHKGMFAKNLTENVLNSSR